MVTPTRCVTQSDWRERTLVVAGRKIPEARSDFIRDGGTEILAERLRRCLGHAGAAEAGCRAVANLAAETGKRF